MMIFMIAAIWADDIKGEPQYSDDGSDGGNTPDGPPSSQNTGYGDLLRHKYWHFVDIPFSSDHSALPSVPVPNAQTQIVAFRATLASTQPDELKSYDLVWLLHLVGDIHQPLHATARITQSDPKGDAGGNKVKLLGDAASNLHSYWDDLPGTECKFCSDKIPCVHRAIVFGKTLGPVTQVAGRNLDTETWAHESFEYARTAVYETPIGPADGPPGPEARRAGGSPPRPGFECRTEVIGSPVAATPASLELLAEFHLTLRQATSRCVQG
jgi:hypothetical protein